MSRLPVVGEDAGAWGTILNEYLTEHVVPTGGIIEYAGAAAPTGFLLCDGTSYLRADYNDLFTALGGVSSPWGLPDGTHFNVPDMRGRMTVGLGPNASVDTLGENDGSALADRGPGHRHTVTDDGHTHNVGVWQSNQFGSLPPDSGGGSQMASFASASATTGISVGPAGSPMDTPAYVVVNYIIKT